MTSGHPLGWPDEERNKRTRPRFDFGSRSKHTSTDQQVGAASCTMLLPFSLLRLDDPVILHCVEWQQDWTAPISGPIDKKNFIRKYSTASPSPFCCTTLQRTPHKSMLRTCCNTDTQVGSNRACGHFHRNCAAKALLHVVETEQVQAAFAS